MKARARAWMHDHPGDVPLLRRCWRKGPRSTPEDKAALAAWVTDRVMTCPWPAPWVDWPPRYVHVQPHRDLSDLVLI